MLVYVINAPSVIAKGLITGTAIFINDNGDMLTNRHVIENCHSLMVKPNDERLIPLSQVVPHLAFEERRTRSGAGAGILREA